MFKKSALLLLVLLAFAACASGKPRIIQTSPGSSDEVRLTAGMATQIEMPDDMRVQSVVAGNPALVTAETSGNVVNLIAKGSEGETNLIIRAMDEDGRAKVYQYRAVVQN